MSTDAIAAVIAMLAELDTNVSDAERIDRLTALERVKSAVAAAQARFTDAFNRSELPRLVKGGADARDAQRSVCAQVWLARRDSPHKAAGMWAWPPPWCTRCPACSGLCSAGRPASGGPPLSPGKPRT